MLKLTVILVLSVVLSVVYAQKNGEYRPEPPRQTLPSIPTNTLRSGQYKPDPGRYRPDNRGRSGNSDGKYRPENDGKYHPDESGKYSGKADPYKHLNIAGGQYQGSKDIIPPYVDLQGPNGPSNDNESPSPESTPPKAPSPPITPKAPPTPRQPINIVQVSGPGIDDINSQYADANGQSTLGVPTGLEQGSAAGLYDNRNYAIIVDDKDTQQEGDYRFKYETENKIFGEETGQQVGSGDEIGAAATGYFKYTGPDNIVYTVNYHAGPEGFVAEAAHIPTPPPIPELILRALEYQKKVGVLNK